MHTFEARNKMLTKVILEGPMGKAFGKKWELQVNSPSEALRMIDANKPGVFAWIKANLQKYSHYRVVCEYEDGRVEHLAEGDYPLERKMKTIRFVPVISGAGGAFQAILGIVLIVVGCVVPGMQALIWVGAGMLIGGVAAMLAPKPNASSNDQSQSANSTSYYFDGPANTTMQGVPVQLIYGTCLVGSHSISAAVTVDQMM